MIRWGGIFLKGWHIYKPKNNAEMFQKKKKTIVSHATTHLRHEKGNRGHRSCSREDILRGRRGKTAHSLADMARRTMTEGMSRRSLESQGELVVAVNVFICLFTYLFIYLFVCWLVFVCLFVLLLLLLWGLILVFFFFLFFGSL